MIAAQPLVFGLCGAALVAIGFYGFVTHDSPLRRVTAFNVAGSGLFLMLGALGRRAGGDAADPVPQALIITGVVVALSATALALALIGRLEALEDPKRPAQEAAEDGP